jgi:Beta-lactamase associated winged helix domain
VKGHRVRTCSFVASRCRSDATSAHRGIRPDLVTKVYVGLDPSLVSAAGLSSLSRLEDLRERGLVVADGFAASEPRFRRV